MSFEDVAIVVLLVGIVGLYIHALWYVHKIKKEFHASGGWSSKAENTRGVPK